MTDDLGFGRVDDELRAALQAAAPPTGDSGAVLDVLRPRMDRARRRHRAVLTVSGSIAAVTVVAASLTVLGPGSGRVATPPAGRSHDAVTTLPVPTTSTVDGTSPPTTSTTVAPAPAGTTPSPTTPTSPVTQTFTSAGGSITVRLAGGALALVSSQPAPGFSEERHDLGPERVEVRFRGGVEWRIRVDLEAGAMVPSITSS
jgi:hypothetical protein